MSRIATLLLFSCVGLISAVDVYPCNGILTIDPPANISNTFYYYPSNWNDSLSAPSYEGNNNCTWVVNVPSGMFAWLSFKSETNMASNLTVTNSIGTVTRLGGDYNEQPFYFNSPMFILHLSSQTSGKLGIRVAWYNYPEFKPLNQAIKQKGDPIVIDSADLNNATIFTADTRVSLVGLPTQILTFTPYMKSTFIFDGPSWNSTFIGTLDDCISSLTQCVSTGKQMTVFTLFPGFKIGSSVLIQDYADVSDINQYRGLVCLLPNNCQINVQANQGKAAVVTYSSSPYYLTSATISSTGSLKVYYGKLQESNLVKAYTNNETLNSFPQRFFGILTTYIIDRDVAQLVFSTDKAGAGWNDAKDGRVGFITSQNYLNPMVFNLGIDEISGNDNYNYTFSFRDSGIVGKATLQVSVLKKDKTTYDQTFSVANPAPNNSIVAAGNALKVSYNSNGDYTTGYFMDFSIKKINSASGYYLLSLLVSVLAFNQL